MSASDSPPVLAAHDSPVSREVGSLLGQLQLGDALTLLRQAGVSLPDAPGLDPVAFLQQVIDGLGTLSLRDALTGLANRRQLDAAIDREVDRVSRTGESALLLMVDLDLFKLVNDRHGHSVGDRVLQSVAQRLTSHVRPMDLVARLGGEEFAIVLPNCSPSFGAVVGERLRHAVCGTPIECDELTLQVTVSIGGAFAPAYLRSSREHWIGRADHHLYLAKAQGRNRVSLEDPPMSTVTNEEKSLLLAALTREPDVLGAA